jgi:hypothetical protein
MLSVACLAFTQHSCMQPLAWHDMASNTLLCVLQYIVVTKPLQGVLVPYKVPRSCATHSVYTRLS